MFSYFSSVELLQGKKIEIKNLKFLAKMKANLNEKGLVGQLKI